MHVIAQLVNPVHDTALMMYVYSCVVFHDNYVHTCCVGTPEFPTRQLLFKHCCDRKKITCFRKLSQLDIDVIREEFYGFGNETVRNQYVLDYFRTHSHDCKKITYTVAGQVICENSWRMVYGIRYNKFKSLILKFQSGVIRAIHGRASSSNLSTDTMRMTCWMRSFFSKVGDRMPMSNELHLPSCLTKADVYELACDDLTQGGLQCSSLSQFYSIWTAEFNYVKIPKV